MHSINSTFEQLINNQEVSTKTQEKSNRIFVIFHLETNSTYATGTPIYHLAFAGDAGNDHKTSFIK